MDKMYTVHEVSALTGVSIRTLRYYDRIGLLRPDGHSEAGYRLYGEPALVRLQCVMLFRTLEFPLKDIRAILDSAQFARDADAARNRALDRQIALLQMKRDRLDRLILLAKGLRAFGVDMENLQFEAFDTAKLDQCAAEARDSRGENEALREYERKREGRTREQEALLGEGLMARFAEFGALRGLDPDDAAVRAQVERLRDYVSAHCFACTPELLLGFAAMCAGGGAMTEDIDRAGGPGTGRFIARAIRRFVGA